MSRNTFKGPRASASGAVPGLPVADARPIGIGIMGSVGFTGTGTRILYPLEALVDAISCKVRRSSDKTLKTVYSISPESRNHPQPVLLAVARSVVIRSVIQRHNDHVLRLWKHLA
jgi:hypothetical protein